MVDFLPYMGVLLMFAIGLLCILAPIRVADAVGLNTQGGMGVSEIRATYGGLFTGLSGAALWFQQAEVFGVLGVGWLCTAAVRTVAVFVDKAVGPVSVGGIVFEVAMGLALLSALL